MKVKSKLTEQVLACQSSGQGTERLVDQISVQVYFFSGKGSDFQTKPQPDDDYCNFFLQFYPKIPQLITNFQDRGIPFESYLATYIRYEWLAYRSEKSKKQKKENTIIAEEIRNYDIGTPEDPTQSILQWKELLDERTADILGSAPDERSLNSQGKKRLLLTASKAAYFVNDNQIRILAEGIGMATQNLRDILLPLRETVHRRTQRLKQLERRRTRLFTKIIEMEKKILNAEASQKEPLRTQCQRHRERFETLSQTINKVSLVPTNAEIAAQLNIPKGTVDSSLSQLKKRIAKVL